jgi:hypothetical protein
VSNTVSRNSIFYVFDDEKGDFLVLEAIAANPSPHANFHFGVVFRQKLVVLEGLVTWDWSHRIPCKILHRLVFLNLKSDQYMSLFRILVPQTYIKKCYRCGRVIF